MTALRYKDYQGSVEFVDGSLIIQILHIEDTVFAECDSAMAAQRVFEELVDDYIATCAEVGKDPCKAFKGSFNVRISPDLHRQIAMAATDAHQSMNAWIEGALEERIERQKLKKNFLDPNMIIRAIESRPHSLGYDFVDLTSTRYVRTKAQAERWRVLSGSGKSHPYSRLRPH